MALWSDLTPAQGGVISSGLNLGGSVVNTLLQNHLNNKAYERQVARQDELIADERAYNDPKAQMQRLEAAGINPAFSQMGDLSVPADNGAAIGNSAPIPATTNVGLGLGDSFAQGLQASATVMDARTNYKNAVTTAKNGQSLRDLQSSQIKEISANIDKITQECLNLVEEFKLIKSKKDLTDSQTIGNLIDNNWKSPQYQQAYRIGERTFKKLGFDLKLLTNELQRVETENFYLPLIRAQELSNSKKEGEVLNQTASNLAAQTETEKERRETEKSTRRNIDSKTTNEANQAWMTKYLAEKYQILSDVLKRNPLLASSQEFGSLLAFYMEANPFATSEQMTKFLSFLQYRFKGSGFGNPDELIKLATPMLRK